MNRRQILRGGAMLAGSVLAPTWPAWLTGHVVAAQQPAAPPVDPIGAMRAQLGAAPIQSLKLSDNLTLLSGPGGNIVVLTGRDGKIVVDTFVQPAWERLKQTLEGMGGEPVKAAIDTHWHFDHADNNAAFRTMGAAVIAHENTPKRMSEPHELLGGKIPPSPPEALPTQTFKDTHRLDANGEQITLGYVPPAHTDTDIYIKFAKGNVLHLGDLFFNGMYPFIDGSTRGSMSGMIAASDLALKLADASTKIVPGHGPLGDRATLTQFRDMLVTVRERVLTLKTSGKTVQEVVAAKPTADLDAVWGKGFFPPDAFVALAYATV